MQNLRNKVAVVTGAASGIGLACAKAFAGSGMKVALLDIRSDELALAVTQVQAIGADAIGMVVDVKDATAVENAATAVLRHLGNVHLLMNNAGVFIRGPEVSAVGNDVWDWLLGVNLYGPINGIRAFLPGMRAHGEGGQIVNTASISGFLVGDRRSGIYSTAKFALVGLSEALRLEVAGDGIGVSVIMPGPVSSDFYVTSAVHRGDLGGPNEFPTTPLDNAAGMSPDEVAARTLAGIQAGEFYIATHSEMREPLEGRHREMMAAYDRAEAWRAPPPSN